MRAHSEKDAITYDVYVTLCTSYFLIKSNGWLVQVLIKDLESYHSVHYKNTKLQKFEIFLQISLGKYTATDAVLGSSNVTFSQALIFFQVTSLD